MAYKTLLEVTSKINRDLDLEAEEFIQPAEMTEYVNDAITIIEAHMNTLGLRDQYFLTRTTVNMVAGTEDYALPTNLYENKIKQVLHKNGATLYTVKIMNRDESAEDIEYIRSFSSGDYYHYRIRNDSSTNIFLQLIPAARENVTGGLIIEFFRDLERVSADADLIEVPEIAIQYMYQFIKVKVYEKETHSNYQIALSLLKEMEALMLETLRGQTADPDSMTMDQDFTHYEEST